MKRIARKHYQVQRNGDVVATSKGRKVHGWGTDRLGYLVRTEADSDVTWKAYSSRGVYLGYRSNQGNAGRLVCYVGPASQARDVPPARAARRRRGGRRTRPARKSAHEVMQEVLGADLPAGEPAATRAIVGMMKRLGCTQILADNGAGRRPPNRRVPRASRRRRFDIEAVCPDGSRVCGEVKTHYGLEERAYSKGQIRDHRKIAHELGWTYVVRVVEDR